MGVTVLAASGDDGASDGDTSGTPTVDFPAASPYVVGCGGTKLTISGSTISSEQAWNELSANEGATGGGVSEVFALPSFQQSANVPKAPNGFVGRGVPDVAGDADPETGYSVWSMGAIGDWRDECGRAAVGGAVCADQSIARGERGVRQSAAVFGEGRSVVSRHYVGKQWRLFRGSWLGCLYGTRQSRWRGAVDGAWGEVG